jgi:hypothetical protein
MPYDPRRFTITETLREFAGHHHDQIADDQWELFAHCQTHAPHGVIPWQSFIPPDQANAPPASSRDEQRRWLKWCVVTVGVVRWLARVARASPRDD